MTTASSLALQRSMRDFHRPCMQHRRTIQVLSRRLTFLCAAEESTVLLERKVDLNKVCTSEKLDDHARSDDGSDTELHECSTVGGENDTHPVERVSGVGGHDAVERDLRADEED